MAKRYVRLLTREQVGLINALIIELAKQEKLTGETDVKAELHMRNVTARASWLRDKKDLEKDVLIVRFSGLTTSQEPAREEEVPTLPDGKTVLVGDVTMSPEEA